MVNIAADPGSIVTRYDPGARLTLYRPAESVGAEVTGLPSSVAISTRTPAAAADAGAPCTSTGDVGPLVITPVRTPGADEAVVGSGIGAVLSIGPAHPLVAIARIVRE